MQTLKDLIEKYVDEENTFALDQLFDKLSVNGTEEEKKILAEGYLSNFAQCQYDYMCGKFNDIDWIWELIDWLEKVKVLDAEFDELDYYKGHVYEMLSSTSEKPENKIKFNKLSTAHFRKQIEHGNEDVDVQINLAKSIFEHCQLTKTYKAGSMQEICDLLVEAIHLERKAENQYSFFGFNGSSISAFLNTAYEILALQIKNSDLYHHQLINAFRNSIQQYTDAEPMIYYHWADTLHRITQWVDYTNTTTSRLSFEVVERIWLEIRMVMENIIDIYSESEHFLTSAGHLFVRLAEKEHSYYYYKVSLNYYKKALAINSKTWSNPLYASNSLKMMAYISLEDGDSKKALDLFNQGLQIYETSQKELDDFQLNLNHADFLFEYARLFEGFSSKNTLLEVQKLYEASKALANNFYTQPFYGLAKTALKLKDKQACVAILKECGAIFSNEYHTHDFNEIKTDKDFVEIHELIPQIIEEIEKGKG
ncbi:MAG: hypothetical protein CMO01_10890 [Thalassobius sp.]|nr:hypothetical protein [Thalassovita sp.]